MGKITRLPITVPDKHPIVDGLVLAATLDPYLSLAALASYTSISVRMLRTYIAQPVNALPHYRFGSRIIVRASEWTAWAQQYRKVGAPIEGKIKRLQARLKKPAA